MDALQITDLNKSFGSHQVLRDISFTVPCNTIFGFLGQNGAGKTTTMKLILGLLKADSGQIQVLGRPVSYGDTKTNRLLGYLPDVPEFYGYMTPREYLALCGKICGLSSEETRKRSAWLLELVGLADSEKKKIRGFSRGMKQRLGIAQALLGKPKLLICDEPTSALDPVGRRELLDILCQVRNETTVLFSTHILSDAEQICQHIAILHQSRLAIYGNLEKIKNATASHSLLLQFPSVSQACAFAAAPQLLPYSTSLTVNKTCVTVSFHDPAPLRAAVLSALYGRGLFPIKMEIQEPSLEKIFMEVVQ